MIKIDLSQLYLGLDSLPYTDPDGKQSTLGKMLASSMATALKVDSLKFMSWAQKLYAGEVIEVDASDFRTLYDWVKTNQNLFALFAGQVLKRLDECEKASK